MSSTLEGRVAVVFGVANKRSIAWSIAQGLHNAGAKLAVTYQNERLEQEARDLILSLPGAEAFMCDVSNDSEIEALFSKLKERYGKLHVLVHSVAFAPADELKGEFLNTTRGGFGDMQKSHAERAPLQRNVDVNEVGATGVFLASDASSGITGEVIHVDCGYNIMGF